jgi:thiamine-phosphate pyrophosphorylase
MRGRATTALWRALDANANRAREGLRVAEDVARFVWNDASLTAFLKKIRHGVTGAETRLFHSVGRRLSVRDVQGDPGCGNREKSEKKRRGPSGLFRANLKRAQEALRSLEEFSKLIHRVESKAFKRLRYAAYLAEEKAEEHL